MRKITWAIFSLLVLSSFLAAQPTELKIKSGSDVKSTPAFLRKGTLYLGSKEAASLLGANYFYNAEAAKSELKFKGISLKFTGKNQFVVVTDRRDNSQNIFQIPVSTLQLNGDLYFPLVHVVRYLSFGLGRKIVYDVPSRRIEITSEPYTLDSLLKQAVEIKQVKTVAEIPVIEPKKNAATPVPANAKYDIYGISIEEKANGTLIRFKAARRVNLPRRSLNDNTLFVFFQKSSIAPDITRGLQVAGLVKEVKRVALSADNNQLQFKLKEEVASSEIFRDSESNDILITIHTNTFAVQPGIDASKSKWIFDVVVIDAGHGGKDPGAIGTSGIKEKDINLSIALKIGKLVEKKLAGVKVIYTRDSDKFVELYKRGKIANEAGGKLFISIHCNSMPKKNTGRRGFEVYLLRPGRTQEAIAIAEFENSVIEFEENPERYQKLTDENFILVSMAHSQYMRYSEKFSDLLNQEWERHVDIPSLGIKQAGFYVLVGASMPSVLVETGFLSNKNDEAHLASQKGQNEIALAVFNAIKRFKEHYDKEVEISN